jgi:hypothetical protein
LELPRKQSGTVLVETIKNIESLIRLRQAKGLIQGPSARRMMDLLRLNRDQLRWVVGLLTGHCHLKEHLFKLGRSMIPSVKGAWKKTNQPHTSCVIVRIRLCHLGQFFMEPSDYYDAPINKVLHFIRGVGLIKG